jgi:hypothetical protein
MEKEEHLIFLTKLRDEAYREMRDLQSQEAGLRLRLSQAVEKWENLNRMRNRMDAALGNEQGQALDKMFEQSR